MADSGRRPKVIVVSSHVASGTVGNRAAVFALERLGFPVVAVPTVILPWHPGEGPASRIVPPDDAFAALLDDLSQADWLDSVSGVLSGYLGEPGQAEAVAALVVAVKKRNPRAVYLCDPVSGDTAGAYVPAAIVEAIASRLLPLADIATPNRYELKLLLGAPARDEGELIAAARQTGTGEVLVTSAFAGPGEMSNVLVTPDAIFRARHRAGAAPHGTGDLLSALYLGHRLSGVPMPDAFGRAVGSTVRMAERARGSRHLPLAEEQALLVDPDQALQVERIG
jgi:pyridoxine kinase